MAANQANPLLSVVVPAYNRADDIATLLASLESEFHRLEAIVVDDCSPDPTIYDGLKAHYPQVRFIRQDRNGGPAAARNRGAREARAELLFLVDSDTAIVPGTIDTILQLYRDHPEFVVCGGTSDRQPLNDGLFPRYKALLEASWVADRADRVTYIGHVGSRAFTIRRSTMLELGGFNENLPTADVEDYEFGYRLYQAHGPIPFYPRIAVRHRYDTLLNQAKLYFRRVIMWWDLRSMSPGADDVGSTSHEAAIAVLSTLMTIAWLSAIFIPSVWLAAFGLTVAAMGFNHRFLRLCLGEYGLTFTAVALAMHTFLSWFICAGAAVAVLQSLMRRLRRLGRSTPGGQCVEASDAV
ncbi:MAG: glycosyltransferase [Planctomycetes bacterium]|nr:glycosyltransferase [Planctomycetota bacterium]